MSQKNEGAAFDAEMDLMLEVRVAQAAAVHAMMMRIMMGERKQRQRVYRDRSGDL